MKQFYYTSCLKETSVTGNAGYQIRAISDNTDLSMIESVLKYSGYQLPVGIPLDISTKITPPTRMAYLKMENGEYCIIHSSYVGKTPEEFVHGIARWGNYFTHGIINLDNSITAKEVIASWGDPFWLKMDPDPTNPIKLKDVIDLPVSDKLDFSLFEDNDDMLDGLEFLINAYLDLKDDQKIFVVADSEVFAYMLYGLCISLPDSMLKDLTFSTYEHSPQSCSAKIICSYMVLNSPADPISFSYKGSRYIGINFINKSKTILPKSFEYANFVKNMMSINMIQYIKDFYLICNEYEIVNGNQLELFYNFYKDGNKLEFEDEKLDKIIETPIILQYIFSQPEGVEWIIELSFKTDHFIENKLPQLIDNLPDKIKKYIRSVLYQKTKECVKKHNISDLKIFDKMWNSFPKRTDIVILQELIVDLTTNKSVEQIQAYSWEIRSFMLTKWSKEKSIEKKYPNLLEVWLSVRSNEITQLFSLRLNKTYYRIAMIRYVDKFGNTKTPYSLIKNYNLALPIFEHFYEKNLDRALSFFRYFYKESIKEKNTFSSNLLIQIINEKSYIHDNSIDTKRLNFIKTITGYMEDFSALDVYTLFVSQTPFTIYSNLIDFLFTDMLQERILQVWISIFLNAPSKEWVIDIHYQNLLATLKRYLNKYNKELKRYFTKKQTTTDYINKWIEYIEQWTKLYRVLSDLYRAKEEKTISEVDNLLKNLFNKKNVGKNTEIKLAIINKIANNYITRFSSDSNISNDQFKSIFKIIKSSIGKRVSYSEKKFLFDLTDELVKLEDNFFQIKNIYLIEKIIKELYSFYYPHQKETRESLVKLFNMAIKQNSTKLNSLIEKKISNMLGSAQLIAIWKKCKSK